MKAKKITGPTVIESVSPDDVASHKIYSVNASQSLGGGNRVKTITVTGIPGSTFTLMTQDENNQLFSFKAGAFGPTPSPLTGVVPLSGVFRKKINTGRAKKVEVRLQSAAPDAVTEVVTQTVALEQLTINIDGTGLSNYTISGATSYVSPPIAAGGNAVLNFEFIVRANTEKLVNYVRAPKFSYKQSTPEGFVLYDGVAFSENALAHSTNANGIRLGSDFKITEATGWETTDFKIKSLIVDPVSGEGEVPEASVGHSTWVSDSLRIKGEVHIGSMGTEDLTLNLMLYNFLEIL